MQRKYSVARARAVVKGDAQDLGRMFMKNYQEFDMMTANANEFMRNEEAHSVIADETFDLPKGEYVNLRYWVSRFEKRVITYWASDTDGIFYVLRTSLEKRKAEDSLNEALVCIPLPNAGSQDKCMVYFISDF